ncbi:unnamed protein product [Alternaria alternata]
MNEPPSYSSAVSDHPHDSCATVPQCQFSRHPPQSPHDHERDTPSPSASDDKDKRSLDLIQRLEKKLAEYNASQNIFKRWLFEIVSWLVSAACMGAIVGIYISISGKEMAQSERLLTMANLLGKVASASLIVPTSEALGQLKWHWFHQSKAMWDFEVFDKASRGAWGATLLLFRTKGRSLAALGALLIVLLLAIDTFFQQVVTFPNQWALQNASSSIPLVTKYFPPHLTYFLKGEEQGMYDQITAPVIKSYFYENGSQPVPFGTFQIMVIWDDFFPASYTAANMDQKPKLRFKNYPIGPSTRFLDFNPWMAPNNVTHHMQRLASALTNVIRSNPQSHELLVGEAYNEEKFIYINWSWLIFPILLLVLSLVFLVATIFKTSKDTDTGIWKTSAIPALIYSLPKDLQPGLATSVTSRSKKVRIRLMPKQGWRVSGQVQPVSTAPPGFI